MTAGLRAAVRPVARAAVALALLAATACAAQHPVRALADGALQVDCNGGYHDWSACYTAAQRHCGKRGYRVISEISDEGGAVGVGDWSREGSEVSRTMEFRCSP